MRAVRRVAFSISLFAIGVIASAVGCKGSSSGGTSALAGPAEWNRSITRPDDATAVSMRASCAFKAGALPGETLGASTPVDSDIPIQKIIVLMQENRSFDSYYGALGKFANRTDIEVAPDNATNPEQVGVPNSPTHTRQHQAQTCTLDTDHSWSGSHFEYDNGLNDGFWQQNNDTSQANGLGSGDRSLDYYDQTDLPFYYQLASTFGIADHYHCGLMGPTWPNRMYLYSATSFGVTDSNFPDLTGKDYPDVMTSVFDELDQRQISWNIFTDGTPGAGVVYSSTLVTRWAANPVKRIADLMADLAAGTLPQVSFIDSVLSEEGPVDNDEHPPSNIQIGQKSVADIILALMQSPDWPHVAFFLNYDENGGFYDHVPPPNACPPDGIAPILTGDDAKFPGAFDRYGFRVPLIVVSPYAKKSYVSHNIYDHTSVTRFIEAKFRLPALTARDANADALMDFFDFKNPPFVTPPSMSEPTVDQSVSDYCAATYGKPAGG